MILIERPTLAELRTRVHKQRSNEIGNWLARRWGRPMAIYGTWAAVRLGLTAHHVTALSLLSTTVSCVLIATGARLGFLVGVLGLHLAFWLDHVDGQVARWRRSASLDGVYFDYLMHHYASLALGFSLGFGLAVGCNDPLWSAAGFAMGLGFLVLGLHNDCRYKAMFQCLKRETRRFRVDGGAGGRPGPPSPWPKRGPGRITWPLFKLCESHVVLILLTFLAPLALISPTTWLLAWKMGVAGMAVLAPSLSVARAVRSIRTRAVEAEFHRWFRVETERRA